MSDELDESPLAGRANAHSGAKDEDDGEDLPDWIAFADFAKSFSRTKGGSATKEPVIPKRGEKDFEPALEDRHVDLQVSLLEASRNALFTAISSGSRQHSSRNHNRAIWDKRLARAYMVPVHDPASHPASYEEIANSDHTAQAAVYGVHFLTMGSYDQQRKQVELLPEEALYLIERGTIECWTSELSTAVPMSVQHAWASMIDADELTAERYQVYAFLRRLGYTVIRSTNQSNPLANPDNKVEEALSYGSALRDRILRMLEFPLFCWRKMHATLAPRTATALERLERVQKGIQTSLVGGHWWFTYDKVFSSLQFIASGRSAPLSANRRHTNPYKVFYNVYKPVTKFKKTDPPPPDYRIGAINASVAMIPDLWDFQNVFAELAEHEPPVVRQGGANESVQSIWHDTYAYIRNYIRPVADTAYAVGPFGHGRVFSKSMTRAAPYARLKTGSKAAIIAVVDNGTISFQRFGSTDFAELPWVGGRL